MDNNKINTTYGCVALVCDYGHALRSISQSTLLCARCLKVKVHPADLNLAGACVAKYETVLIRVPVASMNIATLLFAPLCSPLILEHIRTKQKDWTQDLDARFNSLDSRGREIFNSYNTRLLGLNMDKFWSRFPLPVVQQHSDNLMKIMDYYDFLNVTPGSHAFADAVLELAGLVAQYLVDNTPAPLSLGQSQDLASAITTSNVTIIADGSITPLPVSNNGVPSAPVVFQQDKIDEFKRAALRTLDQSSDDDCSSSVPTRVTTPDDVDDLNDDKCNCKGYQRAIVNLIHLVDSLQKELKIQYTFVLNLSERVEQLEQITNQGTTALGDLAIALSDHKKSDHNAVVATTTTTPLVPVVIAGEEEKTNDEKPPENVDVEEEKQMEQLPLRPYTIKHVPGDEAKRLVAEWKLNVEFTGTTQKPHPKAYLERLAACIALFKQMNEDGIRSFVDVGADAVRTANMLYQARADMEFHAMMPYVHRGDTMRQREAAAYLDQRRNAFTTCEHLFATCKCMLQYQARNVTLGAVDLYHSITNDTRSTPVIEKCYDALFFCHSIYYISPSDLSTRLHHTSKKVAYVIAHEFDVLGNLCEGELSYYTDFDGMLMTVADGQSTVYRHPDPAWLGCQTYVDPKSKTALEIEKLCTVGSSCLYRIVPSRVIHDPYLRPTPFGEIEKLPHKLVTSMNNSYSETRGAETFQSINRAFRMPVDLRAVSIRRISGKVAYITTCGDDEKRTVVTLPAGIIAKVAEARIGKALTPEVYQTAIRQARAYLANIRLPPDFKTMAIITAAAIGMHTGAQEETKVLATVNRDHRGVNEGLQHALGFGAFEDEGCCYSMIPTCFFPGTLGVKQDKAKAWGTSLANGLAANTAENSIPLHDDNVIPANTTLKTKDADFKMASSAKMTVGE